MLIAHRFVLIAPCSRLIARCCTRPWRASLIAAPAAGGHRSLLHPPLAGIVLCSVLIAHSSLLFLGCEDKLKPPISSSGLGQDVPTQESWNATITFTDSGRVTAVLRAGHIAMFAEKKYTLLDSNIVVDFFDENEHHTSVLTARRGRVNDITHDLEAHENVVVVSDSSQTTLKTEDLFWNNTTQRVYTPAYVEILSPKEQIRGHGLESDAGLKEYKIFKVTGQAKSE